MVLTGSCACGYVKYEADTEPKMKIICHCIPCQKFTASAFSVNVVIPKNTFKITTGKTKNFSYTADSSKKYHPHFCPECGSGIYGEPEAMPEMVSIKAGTLDNGDVNLGKVDCEAYVKRRVDYVCAFDGVPQHENMVPI